MEDFVYRARPWAITLVLHNWPVIICLPLILWSALVAYLRPSRPPLLALYGSLILTAAFEYQKHGLETVRTTTDYLFETQPYLRLWSQWLLMEVLAPLAAVVGLALLALSLLLSTAVRAGRRSQP